MLIWLSRLTAHYLLVSVQTRQSCVIFSRWFTELLKIVCGTIFHHLLPKRLWQHIENPTVCLVLRTVLSRKKTTVGPAHLSVIGFPSRDSTRDSRPTFQEIPFHLINCKDASDQINKLLRLPLSPGSLIQSLSYSACSSQSTVNHAMSAHLEVMEGNVQVRRTHCPLPCSAEKEKRTSD